MGIESEARFYGLGSLARRRHGKMQKVGAPRRLQWRSRRELGSTADRETTPPISNTPGKETANHTTSGT